MAIGFSDNWLFDVQQESNSDPRFLIHAFFAFCWYSLLVAQASLIASNRVSTHMSLGIAGMVAYAGFFLATSYIYVDLTLTGGPPGPLRILNIASFIFATVLITQAFVVRRKNS